MKIKVYDANEDIIQMQKALIFQLRMSLHSSNSRNQEIQYSLAKNYEKGWKDAVKKIDNFIERHCKEYV